MTSRAFSAYNEASKRSLASGITTVDSIDEPIKVLKILLEGLAPASGAGIWITRFRGLPVARSYSPFDLIYLNEEFRVVQAVEITKTSRFEPFKGQPTSALVLPPGSIVSSRTFDGDRIRLRADAKADPQPKPERVSPKVAKAAIDEAINPLVSPTRRVKITIEPLEVAAPPTATLPGSVLKPAKRPQDVSPSPPAAAAAPTSPAAPPPPVSVPVAPQPDPANQAVAAEPAISHPPAVEAPSCVPTAPLPEAPAVAAPIEMPAVEPPLMKDAPIAAPALDVPVIDAPAIEVSLEVQPVAPIEPEMAPAPVDAVASVVPPIPLSVPEEIQPPAVSAEIKSVTANEAPIPEPVAEEALSAADAGEGSEDDLQLQIPEAQSEPGQKAMELARRWDVRLLYALFPELHPTYRPEFQVPYIDIDPLRYGEAESDEKPSKKAMLLSYIYPELELETVEKRQRQQRRAPRISDPGLVGYFFSAGHAEPHKITNFSVMGFYMETEERWLPGTVIRVTLQMMDSDGSEPGDTITVHARVVNWDERGGGFEFVLPGFID
ncbi:MAG TPA: hypothetical protein VMU48_07720 [Terracidiphilus sp.]|nr:hypothetical protein [Terracidiphilus sp.]